MKKGINAWCFPSDMSFDDMFALAKKCRFDGIEINMEEAPEYVPPPRNPCNPPSAGGQNSLDNQGGQGGQGGQGNQGNMWNLETLRLHMGLNDAGYSMIKACADKYDLPITSVSTNLHWKFPLTDDDPATRERGCEIVRKMIDAAQAFGCDTVLLVPGAVTSTVSYATAYNRAQGALLDLRSYAEDKKITIGVENVWNKFLLSPLEMARFLDDIGSDYVKAYFDAGNVLQFSYPQSWVEALGKRIAKVHVKDFDPAIGNITGFKPLLQGDLDWAALMRALRDIGYDNYLTAELSPYPTNPTQLIHDTSAAMDYIISL